MKNTYRTIFKWGDKREESLDKGIVGLLKEKFDFSDKDFRQHYLFGDEEIKIGRAHV